MHHLTQQLRRQIRIAKGGEIDQHLDVTIADMLLPATTSPEMLVAKLAGERPANYEKLLPFEQRNEDLATRFAGQRGIIIDEASKMLIPKKYMEGHTETMMEMFDAPRRLERELRGDGKLIVYNPALALIGATTPARLSIENG